jgi:hypothetical protein
VSPLRPGALPFAGRVLATLTWLGVCGLLPLATFAHTTLAELDKGATPDPSAWSIAAFYLALWLFGLAGSGASLLLTLWARPPRLVRLHAGCWVVLLLPCCAPVGLLGLGLATGRLVDDLCAFVLVCAALGLPAATLLGAGVAAILHLVLPRTALAG